MKILIFLILLILIQPVSAETYRVFVDKEFGFFGVRSNNSTEIINYSDKTLYIDIGDKVEWQNFVASDERVTIISDNKLWNETILGWNYKTYNYTFNKSGTYKFHIKENKIFQLPENFTDPINTSIWFNNQVRIPIRIQTIVVGTGISSNIIPKNNKIIAKNKVKTSTNTEVNDEEEYYHIPETTINIESKVSPYEKYTILEILKQMFNK